MNKPTTVSTELARPTLHILIGIQVSGKSSFAPKQLASPSRINLDTLRSLRKETALLHEPLASRVDIIIDNTKPTRFEYKRTVPAGSKQHFLPA